MLCVATVTLAGPEGPVVVTRGATTSCGSHTRLRDTLIV